MALLPLYSITARPSSRTDIGHMPIDLSRSRPRDVYQHITDNRRSHVCRGKIQNRQDLWTLLLRPPRIDNHKHEIANRATLEKQALNVVAILGSHTIIIVNDVRATSRCLSLEPHQGLNLDLLPPLTT
ncbi:hypothetical protein GOBAR_DD15719 [Gossypium barbadense]|nr:hypothetical protein GOBAR_DD15719 [Gossypium barbadense]